MGEPGSVKVNGAKLREIKFSKSDLDETSDDETKSGQSSKSEEEIPNAARFRLDCHSKSMNLDDNGLMNKVYKRKKKKNQIRRGSTMTMRKNKNMTIGQSVTDSLNAEPGAIDSLKKSKKKKRKSTRSHSLSINKVKRNSAIY